MKHRIRWHHQAWILLLGAGCATAQKATACNLGPTPGHSALAWGPAPTGAPLDARGRVVDARTGAPLPQAYVMIEPGGRAFVTDSLGEFRIPQLAGGAFRIRIRRIGYDDVRDTVTYGREGLRLFAALAPDVRGYMVDYACTSPRSR